MTTDPSSGTVPTGYLILNVTSGTLKRHAGSLSWEAVAGAAGWKLGFYGAKPVVQPSGAEIGRLTISNSPTQAEVQVRSLQSCKCYKRVM